MSAPQRVMTADEAIALVEQQMHAPAARPARTYRRRRRHGQREADKALHNHQTDRWMVSYADFITLLFAFFVVMYAMSSVNETRYRALSGALSTAFSPGDDGIASGGFSPTPQGPVTAPSKAMPSTTEVKPAAASVEAPVEVPKPPAPAEPPTDPVVRAELQREAERVERMQRLAAKMEQNLQKMVRDGQVNVTRGARGIAIEINAAVLFDPAHAELKPASLPALRSLAEVLTGFVEPLQIEGHSDDIPIATREYKSNWELSAARAASVGRFLIDQGIAPGRIGIAGYAEYRPLVGNTTAETRARNRRVTLLILSADDTRPKEGSAPAATKAAIEPAAPAAP
jgi:chemotaxis protein MotB